MIPARTIARTACALALASSLSASGALAHGGIWRASQILIAPDDPGRIVLQSSLRGPILSADAGARWEWMCAETYGQSSISPSPVAMMLRSNGRALVAGYTRGLLLSDDAFCSFRAPQGPALSWTRDLASSAEGIVALASTEVGEEVRDVLLMSRDEGSRFEVLGSPLPADFIARGVEASGGASPRLYVAGLRDAGWTLGRSDDGAVSWTFGPWFLFRRRSVEPDSRRRGTDDPSLVFVLRDEMERSADESQDALCVSQDGGVSFRELFLGRSRLRGFAQSPDGKSCCSAARVACITPRSSTRSRAASRRSRSGSPRHFMASPGPRPDSLRGWRSSPSRVQTRTASGSAATPASRSPAAWRSATPVPPPAPRRPTEPRCVRRCSATRDSPAAASKKTSSTGGAVPPDDQGTDTRSTSLRVHASRGRHAARGWEGLRRVGALRARAQPRSRARRGSPPRGAAKCGCCRIDRARCGTTRCRSGSCENEEDRQRTGAGQP